MCPVLTSNRYHCFLSQTIIDCRGPQGTGQATGCAVSLFLLQAAECHACPRYVAICVLFENVT